MTSSPRQPAAAGEKSRSWDLMPVQVIEEMDVVAVEQPPAAGRFGTSPSTARRRRVAPLVAPARGQRKPCWPWLPPRSRVHVEPAVAPAIPVAATVVIPAEVARAPWKQRSPAAPQMVSATVSGIPSSFQRRQPPARCR